MKAKNMLLLAILMVMGISVSAQDRSAEIRRLLFEANSLQNKGNTVESVESLKSIVRIAPTYPIAYLRLATLYKTDANVKSLGEAKLCYEKYLSLESDAEKKDSVKKVLDEVIAEIEQTGESVAAERMVETVTNERELTDAEKIAAMFDVHVQELADAPIVAVTDSSASNLADSLSTVVDDVAEADGTPETPEISTTPTESFPNAAEDELAFLKAFDDVKETAAPQTGRGGDRVLLEQVKEKPDEEGYGFDPGSPLITFYQPYSFTEMDFQTLPKDTVCGNYISALFSCQTGNDMLKVVVDEKGIVIDTNCGLFRAYMQMMGVNSSSESLVHGVTRFEKSADRWFLRLEYEFPDSMTARVDFLKIVREMLGDYMRVKKSSDFQMKYDALKRMEQNDTLYLGNVRVVYEFFLKPTNGLLVGESKINVFRMLDRDYTIASYTGQQVFIPVESSYVASEISGVEKLEESDPENFLMSKEAKYQEYCDWHRSLTKDDYNATDVVNTLGFLDAAYQPEAIYELYVGHMARLWYLKNVRGTSTEKKKKMIKISNILKSAL